MSTQKYSPFFLMGKSQSNSEYCRDPLLFRKADELQRINQMEPDIEKHPLQLVHVLRVSMGPHAAQPDLRTFLC